MNSRTKTWLIPVLLGLQAAFVSSAFTTWHGCIPLLILALIAAVLHRRWQAGRSATRTCSMTKRWSLNAIVYLSITLVISAWRLGDYAIESINPMAFAFDAVAHAALFSALLLWVIHPIGGHPAMLGLGLLLVLLCLAAGGASHSMTSQIAVALSTTIGFLLASSLILSRPQGQTSGETQGTYSPPAQWSYSSRIGLLFSLLTLSTILITASAIAQVTSWVLPDVQTTLHNQLSNTLDPIQDQSVIGSSRYVRGSRLGSIRRHMLANPASVALTAYADSTPGYLRGTVFDTYSDGRWIAITNERLPNPMESKQIQPRDLRRSGQGLTRLQGRSSQSLSRFYLYAPDNDRVATVEIHNEPTKGQVVFTPLATRWVEADARYLSVSHHDIVEAGVRVKNPYVCGVAQSTKRESMEGQRKSLLLAVPPNIREEIRKLAADVCVSRPTAPAKAVAISDYLSENFSYSLTSDIPRGSGDPVVRFLDLKHAAHCEYFATATVLLLRGAGVPARYVTGYVASEFSEEESYWLARNRDAHAWAEAYDELTGHWFPVESTPGRTYQSLTLMNDDSGFFASGNEGDNSEDDSEYSLLSLAWGWITSMRATDPLYLVFRVGLIPLFCVLAVLIIRNFRQGYDARTTAEDIKSRQMLARIDRRLKKLSLSRQPHETLHQFAARVEFAAGTEAVDPQRHGEFLQAAAQWYRQYAAARYRGQMPAPFGKAA